MAGSKTKRHLPDIAKNVLQDADRTREQVAWELLYAVRDLFPERLQELRALGKRLVWDYNDELGESHPDNKQAEDQFTHAVRDWTAGNGISCAAVDDAAAKYAVGGTPSVDVFVDADFDPDFIDKTPSITAGPYNETRQEFLKRAGKYYDEVAELYAEKDGVKRGPVKRDFEHFRYLVAHLLGGYTWAEIAHGETPLALETGEQQSVAGGAREVASLLGIPLTTRRGPRKGSRRHPRPVRR